MNTPPRQPPRFVPTLTEKIEANTFTPIEPPPGINIEALIAAVWQQVQPLVVVKLQQHSEQWLRATLAQQLQEINIRVQDDIALLVRQAVSDALTPQNRSQPHLDSDNN
ncbi:hypothetical protein [Rhodoferax sp.]|uniref:hypothetical protein n=1 Tax=Rhodoferax sp. TaxID=50421 RepID=UPI0019FA642F|nr:hypothetical protein [Rhodoferax sp.]MBE0473643.1 hypothetical protein [Rhodoferax sp.]